MNRIAQIVGELTADAALFLIAFLLSTGITCGGKPLPVTCDGAQAVEAHAP